MSICSLENVDEGVNRGVALAGNRIGVIHPSIIVETIKGVYQRYYFFTVSDESADSDNDKSGKILATFIVGRKFGEEGELHTGTNISCSDPENTKDPNAIKVLSAESGCNKVLGYIPRELAEHLSKLMNTIGLTFKGRFMSVPGFHGL